MQSAPQELLKLYVQSQHFTSTADIMAAMKEMFRDVIQQVMGVEMDEELGQERCQRAAEENASPALPSAPSPPGSPAVGKRFCRNGCVGCNRLSRHGSFQRIADCGSAPPPLIVLVNIEPVQIRQHCTIVPASLIFLPHFIRVFNKTLKSILLGRRIAASGHCR